MAPPPGHPPSDHELTDWLGTFTAFAVFTVISMLGLCLCFHRSHRLIPTGVYLLTQRLTQRIPADELEPTSEVRRGLLAYCNQDDSEPEIDGPTESSPARLVPRSPRE
ncbi:hypothetical protein H4R33_005727 [Dimargaris cristalligena]|nr:hypothetical protein H4R33_005727 [Dimargaris cristalligena]